MNPPIKNRIKQYRKTKYLRQQELADKLCIDRTYLSKLENQHLSAGPELMYKICTLLEVELGEIFYV